MQPCVLRATSMQPWVFPSTLIQSWIFCSTSMQLGIFRATSMQPWPRPVRFLPLLFLCLCLCLCFSISGCCRKKEPPCYTENLEELRLLNFGAYPKLSVSALRAQSLRESALSVGARAGLAARAKQINCILTKHEALLFRVFNFNAMLLDKNVLPPVLIEGRNTLNLTGTDAIRISDRLYQILAQARFVTAAPIWRDYLWMAYAIPETPDKTLLPRTRPERALWKRYINEGWSAGVQQGDLIFRENLGRLKRDYEGMIRYRTLLAQNMVSPPFVAQLDLGVTGCGTDMAVNDRVLRITAFPALQCDSRNWKAEIIPNE